LNQLGSNGPWEEIQIYTNEVDPSLEGTIRGAKRVKLSQSSKYFFSKTSNRNATIYMDKI
jgi:hypothetical protein